MTSTRQKRIGVRIIYRVIFLHNKFMQYLSLLIYFVISASLIINVITQMNDKVHSLLQKHTIKRIIWKGHFLFALFLLYYFGLCE